MSKTIESVDLKKVVFSDKQRAMVLFTGSWCVDCTAFKPTWEAWCSSKTGPFFTLEIKRGASTWQEWNLREIPTVAVYKDGKELDKASDQISSGDLDRLWHLISSR